MQLLRPVVCRIALPLAGCLMFASIASAQPAPAEVAEQVDRLLAEELNFAAATLAPQTDDATFLRRVWLDIAGDIPSPEHLTAFLLDPRADKRERIVRDLLAKPQYGQNWARYWRDVILYRRLEDRAMVASNAVVVQLTQQLNDNVGWDAIASDFITATGDVRENGSAAIHMAQDGRTEETAAEVSRIFLGVQIQCAQCHDHPWDRWQREDFHQLAAFFPRVGVRPLVTPTRRSFAVVANDRPERRRGQKPGDNVNRRGAPEHYMPDLEHPDQAGTRTQPRFFLTGDEVSFGSQDADRRGQLAEWLTDSPWFATAMVNRMWSELVGEGFYEPVDDLGPDREPTAPAAVEYLSDQFAATGYDVKWLVETICATEAYGREARARRNPNATPMIANVPQRLRGDQLFNTLLTALGISEEETRGLAMRIGGNYGGPITPRMIFNLAFGFDPSVQRETVSASIPQALAMMNTPRVNRAISSNRRTMLGKLLAENLDDEQLIDELYLRCLAREPSSDEREQALAYIESVEQRSQAYEDFLWALLNSAEFSHRR
ncbi:MAG: DUF1549 domain-containing protein [Planctomycetota bacterium]